MTIMWLNTIKYFNRLTALIYIYISTHILVLNTVKLYILHYIILTTQQCMYIITFFIYISAVKFNALMQIHFNGTNFFNARLTQRLFSVWPVAQPVVGEMEMHSVANLATLQTPLATFFPSKKRPNLVSENRRYCCASARSCSPSARTHLSLSVSAQFLFSDRQRGAAL